MNDDETHESLAIRFAVHADEVLCAHGVARGQLCIHCPKTIRVPIGLVSIPAGAMVALGPDGKARPARGPAPTIDVKEGSESE